MLDWRESDRIPRARELYYSRRSEATFGLLVHNTGGFTTIEADNVYHINKDWDGARAPHIAYHLWVPFDHRGFLRAYGVEFDEANPPDAVVVWCNHLWERTWHGTKANDSCIGLACQVDGEAYGLSDGQQLAVRWTVDEWLPSQGIAIPWSHVWGHGETPKVYGGGPDWANNTVCPGRQVLPQIEAMRK